MDTDQQIEVVAPDEEKRWETIEIPIPERKTYISGLRTFEELKDFISNEPTAPVFSARSKLKYTPTNQTIHEFIRNLEKIGNQNFFERQGNNTAMFIDLDFMKTGNEMIITGSVIKKIVKLIFRTIISVINTDKFFEDENINVNTPTSRVLYACVLTRDESTRKGDLFKEGIHIVVPCRSTKSMRQHIRLLISEKCMSDHFSEIVNNIEGDEKTEITGLDDISGIYDPSSESVPVAFINQSKPGSNLHNISYIFKTTLLSNQDFGKISVEDITRRRGDYVENIVDFSMNWSSSIPRYTLHPRGTKHCDDIFCSKHTVRDYVDVHVSSKSGGNVSVNEIEDQVAELCETYPNAYKVAKLVNLLRPERTTEYKMWYKVIVCIANINPNFRPIAHMFSLRCPEKYDREAVNNAFNLAIENQAENPITIRSLIHWAREDGSDIDSVLKQDVYTRVSNIIQRDGNITVLDKVEIMYDIFGDYMVYSCGIFYFLNNSHIFGNHAIKTRQYLWIKADDAWVNGILYQLYTKLIDIITREFEDICTQYVNNNPPPDDQQGGPRRNRLQIRQEDIGYNMGIFNQQLTSMRNLINHGTLFAAIKSTITDNDFKGQLDVNPYSYGIRGGIIILVTATKNNKIEFNRCEKTGKYCPTIIRGSHSYPISKSMSYTYVPPHKRTEEFAQCMDYVRDVIDSMCTGDQKKYMHMLIASLLDRRPKAPYFYIWTGSGGNGKSTLQTLISETFGEDFVASISSTLVTTKQAHNQTEQKIGAPSPELVKMHKCTAVMYSESENGAFINKEMVKRLTGGDKMVARQLYRDMETIETKSATHILATNYPPLIPDGLVDDSLTRRIRIIEFKKRFCRNPSSDVETELPIDYELTNKLSEQKYRDAFLTLAVDWYYIYMHKYGGNMANVESKTIEEDTQYYFDSQDKVGMFVRLFFVNSPGVNTSVVDALEAYKVWYLSKLGGRVRIENPATIENKLCNNQHAIRRFRHMGNNRVFKDVRILKQDEELQPGEDMLVV